MVSVQEDPALAHADCPLSDVIRGESVFLLGGPNEYRRYGGQLATASRVGGIPSVNRKVISYRVGARTLIQGSLPNLRAPAEERAMVWGTRFELNVNHGRELETRFKKYYNTGPGFKDADLSAIVARLGAGMAYYTIHGELTPGVLRSGNHLAVRSLETRLGNLPARGTVFVPSAAAFGTGNSAFIALVAAANGCGVTVLTDQVQINPVNGAAIMPATNGYDLACGCADALRILFNMYAAAGEAAVAAFALAVGINQMVTVTGHTDEGGAVRDVLRQGYFSVPYGGIFTDGAEDYTRFPAPHRHSQVGVQNLVDSIALRVAGAVALSDPLVNIGGRYYPTVLHASRDPQAAVPAAPGIRGVAEVSVSAEQRRNMAGESGAFALNYATNLGEHLLGSSGGCEKIAPIITSQMWALASREGEYRHFNHAVIAPFYWVEPTSLFADLDDGVATTAGYGLLCGTEVAVEKPAWPGYVGHGSTPHREYFKYEHRSARTVPALVHMTHSIEGGLGHVAPYAFPVDEAVCAGDGQVVDPAMPEGLRERVTDPARLWSIDHYMWRHGSTFIPSPAEFVLTGGEMEVRLSKGEERGDLLWDENRVVVPVDHQGEVSVEFIAYAPQLCDLTTGHADNARVRRERTRGSRVLAANSRRMAKSFSGGTALLQRGDVRPGTHLVEDLAPQALEEVEQVEGAGRVWRPAQDRGVDQRRIYVDGVIRPRAPQRGGAAAGGPLRGGHAAPIRHVGVGARPAPPQLGDAGRAQVAAVHDAPVPPQEAQGPLVLGGDQGPPPAGEEVGPVGEPDEIGAEDQ